MKDLMANTVGTVELQQLKQKHEQKVNQLRLTSPVCARQCSPSPLLSSPAKPSRHLSLTPYPHPALMWMTWGGGNGDIGVGYAVHYTGLSHIFMYYGGCEGFCARFYKYSYNSTLLYSSGIDTSVSGVARRSVFMSYECVFLVKFLLCSSFYHLSSPFSNMVSVLLFLSRNVNQIPDFFFF